MEFDIHGAVGIRVEGATEADRSALVYQLGPPQPLQGRAPDLTIRFQQAFDPRKLVYLGLNEMAFDDEDFYILGRRDGAIKASIPFAALGQPCEIRCRHGIGDVPLLHEILMVTLLTKGYLPLHAAAFRYRERGVLVVGWSKGGKTEALLAFAKQEAEYVGDECVVLTPDGQKMFGLPWPVTLWDWQLAQIPKLQPLGASKRLLFRGLRGLDALHRATRDSRLARTLPHALLDKALPTLQRQRKVVQPPHELFRQRTCDQPVAVDKLFLLLSHAAAEIRVESCPAQEVAQRMGFSNEVEQLRLLAYYKAFRYAFPHRRNDRLENASAQQRQLLQQALAGKQAYAVHHPYPVAFDDLFSAMRPYCE